MVKRGVVGTIAAALALLTAGASQAKTAADPIKAAFVVMGENGALQARVITAAKTCPAIRLGARRLAMTVRAAPETVPVRPSISDAVDTKPSAFPVTVCEATLPADAKTAMAGSHRLPLPPAEPKRIVVFGDTGCRVKKTDNAYQACNDPNAYPFARVAAMAAAWKPDLVVHVGDYLYRENACDDAHPGCKGTVWGYGWDAWNADFFTPGKPLLAAAPWVAARGNHESCNRAGQGWWRFIDPRALVKGRDCNDAKDDDTGDYSDPYAVPIGNGAQFIVMDSSKTTNGAIKPDSHAAAAYRDAFARYEALAAQAPYGIMVEHHPILGPSASEKKGVMTLNPGNGGLQSVWGPLKANMTPPNVKMLLAGHVHLWEALSFSSDHPAQFVAGFGGTQEEMVPLPPALPADYHPAPGADVSDYSSFIVGFGFMTLYRNGPDKWDVEVHDVDGKVINLCKVTGSKSVCDVQRVPDRP
jgi:Calcineurin-like phosphoesterase